MIRRIGQAFLWIALIALFFSVPLLIRSIVGGPTQSVADLRPSSDAPLKTSSDPAPTVTGAPSVSETSSKEESGAPVRVARPVRVQIPAVDVDAKLQPIGLLDTGAMEVPDFGLAGWYRLGPRPGESGPAVIVAHVDSYEGPDVFFRLRELAPGDEIKVRHRDGTSTRFIVQSREQQLKQQLPVERIWNKTREPVLRLVTCGGEFDKVERHYRSNVIVYAAQVAR